MWFCKELVRDPKIYGSLSNWWEMNVVETILVVLSQQDRVKDIHELDMLIPNFPCNIVLA